MRGAWREAMGWVTAIALSVVVVGQVASTARSELLFRDGDSLVVALIGRSLLAGDRLDWMFSGVLFLPETAVFTVLRLLLPGLSIMGVLAVNAVVNLVALYGALRFAAGRRLPGRAPVAWALLALAAFGVLALTETSASRDALEPASLQLTTTYYSATVVGAVLAVGLVRRHLERPRVRLLVWLGVVVLVSTVTNPLFLAWAAAPLLVLLLVLLLIARHARSARGPALPSLLVVAAGSALGMAVRIPLSAWIADPRDGYVHLDKIPESVEHYGGLLGDRLATPGGIGAAALTLGLLLLCVLRSGRRSDEDGMGAHGGALVAAYGWFGPIATVAGAILLGTHAARYLEPIAFAPLLGLVARPEARRLPSPLRVTAAVGAVLLAGGALASAPRIHAAATAPDPDAACVVDWVNASGRTGGGQFWTVRLPKVLLREPARLVQVDNTLRGYNWLANRTDFAVGQVTFLLEDAQTVPWAIAGDPQPDGVVTCGRYRILDLASHPLPIGPQRS